MPSPGTFLRTCVHLVDSCSRNFPAVTPSLLLLFLLVVASFLFLFHFCNCIISACNVLSGCCQDGNYEDDDDREERKRSCTTCWRYVFLGLLLLVVCTGISGKL